MPATIPSQLKSPISLLLDLESIPDDVWVLTNAQSTLYVMYQVKDAQPRANGVGVFSTEERAWAFLKQADLVNVAPAATKMFAPVRKTFEEVRMIAKSKKGANSVILLDDVQKPIIHYVE